jgi:hypothetical protein
MFITNKMNFGKQYVKDLSLCVHIKGKIIDPYLLYNLLDIPFQKSLI